MSGARLQHIEEYLAQHVLSADMLQARYQHNQQVTFDPQVTEVARYVMHADGNDRLSLNPAYDDAMLISYSDHENRHLWQYRSVGVFNVAHPMLIAENVFLLTFLTEADAYLHQRLLAAEALRTGDDRLMPHVMHCGQDDADLCSLFNLSASAQVAALNKLFWQQFETLTTSLPLATKYISAAQSVLEAMRGKLQTHTAETLEEVDQLSFDFNPYFERMKPLSTLRLRQDASPVAYLEAENGVHVLAQFKNNLPRIYRTLLEEEQSKFIRDFYAAKDAATTPKGTIIAPKIWVPGSP